MYNTFSDKVSLILQKVNMEVCVQQMLWSLTHAEFSKC